MSLDDQNTNQIIEQDIDPLACRALWCAVIKEQLRVAKLPDWGNGHAKPYEVISARRWFGSRDFFAVCALAGLDGVWVLLGVRRQLQMAGVA
ncbi:MAG: hypothetical protein CSA68_07360 [Rhodobacterales bacterium]|nr:MAG: hypothetical protein CSA68_07360 [Rhodobacterales bacterium]